jgi:hypothetical protein
MNLCPQCNCPLGEGPCDCDTISAKAGLIDRNQLRGLYVWRIETVRWNPDRSKGLESIEYVAAKDIQTVWDEHLAIDRMDLLVEIKSIMQMAPLLDIIPNKDNQ